MGFRMLGQFCRFAVVACGVNLFVVEVRAQITPVISTADIRSIFEECAQLAVNPNHVVNPRLIERVSTGNALSTTITEAIEATICLESLTGEDWAFNPVTNRFVTGMFVDQADRFFAAELAEHRQQEAAAEAERLANIAAQEAERLRSERRAEVYRATLAACLEVYGNDEIEALTSPVCHPIFLETGLPD